MELSKAQSTGFEKIRRRGAGEQGISLADDSVRALVALVARDLDIPTIAGISPLDQRGFYDIAPEALVASGNVTALKAYEMLLRRGPLDTDMYFLSLATLHRARLKFANILRLQGTPALEQVGPRGLLQYGDLTTQALGSLLILRKWVFDIDNRAAQETGYLFEPIIAGAVGGAPVSPNSSPVRRDGTGPGRQVDCLRGEDAYEIKLRVTIAASGQGRWKEELAFPSDCEASGYRPVLIVFDSTENPKLVELKRTFLEHGGEVYIGEDAWSHLKSEAGSTMGIFVDRYIRAPLDDLLAETPIDLPEMKLLLRPSEVRISVGSEDLCIERHTPDP